jgi:hypothetical protein
VSGIVGGMLCTIGTIGLSVGSECVGRRSSVVTGCGRVGEGGEDRGRERMRREPKE